MRELLAELFCFWWVGRGFPGKENLGLYERNKREKKGKEKIKELWLKMNRG